MKQRTGDPWKPADRYGRELPPFTVNLVVRDVQRAVGFLTPVLNATVHYAEHDGKPFFGDLVSFITRGPLVALVVKGPDAWKVVRTLMGATNPRDAAPGTIRGDLAIELTENLVHGSDGPDSAAREIALFFPGLAT